MLNRPFLAALSLAFGACTKTEALKTAPSPAAGAGGMHGLCEPWSPPRIQKINDRVLFAIGFDLANTILIKTSEGHVIIDPGMSPGTAIKTRAALLAEAPGNIRAIIYTHSHLDHVGGASVWAEPKTEIWASEAFASQFFKQYGLFQPLEQLRAGRQYGLRVDRSLLACTAIGPLPDINLALNSGARMPTRTFSAAANLTIGDVRMQLIEAHGETQDQIMVWLPDERILASGDNVFKAFPNLYTIRGTSPRPIDEWIQSLDHVRRLDPETVLPGHTEAVLGRDAIREMVTDYRDAIQWVRDATVRGANLGRPAVAIAAAVRLPEHLATKPYLQQTYGQVDWAARAIYSNEIGWFAGEPEQLYPVDDGTAAAREIALMGGASRVLDVARQALASGDARWAAHLLAKLDRSADSKDPEREAARAEMVKTLSALAAESANTNGRGYLAEYAIELKDGRADSLKPKLDEGLLASVPLTVVFRRMAVALNVEDALDVHESLSFEFPDLGQTVVLTIRRGVAEVAYGEPLPGTPAPVATVRVDSMLWKRITLKDISVPGALASGRLTVDGSWIAAARFLNDLRWTDEQPSDKQPDRATARPPRARYRRA